MTNETVTLKEHLLALREADMRFEQERNLRYAEVAVEREKALRIKEEANQTALGLQRESQQYRDEQANKLREQINNERGMYATKSDLDPIKDYIASQRGRSGGLNQGWGYLIGAVGLIATMLVIVAYFAAK